jgi:peptide/nickel transport system substrate-binding protein
MRLTASASIAAISLLGAAWSLHAARRPHYGGTLRIDMQDNAPGPFVNQVFETLVRFDEKGQPRPLLATLWTHDTSRHRWVFTLRKNVILHNGAPWDPPGGEMTFDDSRPIEDILRDVAQPGKAVVVRAPDGTSLGTGPFRIASQDPAKAIVLEANDAYWGGRPYLDRIEIHAGRAPRDQALDFELNRADVIELPLAEVRRAQQQGVKVVVSAPVQTLALIMDTARPDADRLREALALAIDRSAIRNVLLQHQGDASGALLPQWLTGYAFLFPADRNLTRARELAANAPPLAFAWDAQSPLLRSIAERIVLNAAEAGLTLRTAGTDQPDVRLVLLRINSPDAKEALQNLAAMLNAPFAPETPADPASLYQAERALIATRRIIPLFHLPFAYELSPTVRGWTMDPCGRWQLADTWLDARQ